MVVQLAAQLNLVNNLLYKPANVIPTPAQPDEKKVSPIFFEVQYFESPGHEESIPSEIFPVRRTVQEIWTLKN